MLIRLWPVLETWFTIGNSLKWLTTMEELHHHHLKQKRHFSIRIESYRAASGTILEVIQSCMSWHFVVRAKTDCWWRFCPKWSPIWKQPPAETKTAITRSISALQGCQWYHPWGNSFLHVMTSCHESKGRLLMTILSKMVTNMEATTCWNQNRHYSINIKVTGLPVVPSLR